MNLATLLQAAPSNRRRRPRVEIDPAERIRREAFVAYYRAGFASAADVAKAAGTTDRNLRRWAADLARSN